MRLFGQLFCSTQSVLIHCDNTLSSQWQHWKIKWFNIQSFQTLKVQNNILGKND
ncbi:Hypothetical protein PAU_01475 [Photorhabdus asymbiotica]|uniref:Uncharacterized protein n=1 Tax=Photorhabdus asymbiotica subsp. asymbiotica (strain ATCC 43949 / 3105-77) TaxID=553480 RepID=B6VKP5_PHOAA|nr:Hypothetical protein PAU_01475 [Photorhabdus asymbiotica]CAR66725.1 Hypothetical protein PA-RVA3-4009 [Photorhabdus asymbiotica subsp. asymbiotica ATCC 43949]